ncbi:MAG TPA: hypothetical protein VN889_05145 [Solirubrobacteraceae bacterium]|nr:hypothetical protein [Solirubrobacteraceae bacterium]
MAGTEDRQEKRTLADSLRQHVGAILRDVVAWLIEGTVKPALAAIASILLVSVGIGAYAHHSQAVKAPIPLSEQWQQELSRLSRENWTITKTRVDLRGTGAISTVVSLRRSAICGAGKPPPSNELLIYDEIAGKLVREFQYAPPQGCGGLLSNFQSMDILGDGQNELIGSLDGAWDLKVPIIIDWNDAEQTYQALPLITEHPWEILEPINNLSRAEVSALGGQLQSYAQAVDVGTRSPLGYGVSDYTIVKGASNHPPYLFGVYRVRSNSTFLRQVGPELFQSVVLRLEEAHSLIRGGWCSILRKHSLIKAAPGTNSLTSGERAISSVESRFQRYFQSCTAAFIE